MEISSSGFNSFNDEGRNVRSCFQLLEYVYILRLSANSITSTADIFS